VSLLLEKAGDSETAATGPPPGVPVPADPVPGVPAPADPVPDDPVPTDPVPDDPAPDDPAPDDPVSDDPVSDVRRTRRTGPRLPGPPAPRPARGERTDEHRARRLLVNVIMFPVAAVVGLGLVLLPLLMVAAGVALPIWSSRTLDATHGTFVVESCHYDKVTTGGERSTFSQCTGRFVAEDGSLVVERATFERGGTIEGGDRISAWVSEPFGADNAMGNGEFYWLVFGAVSMWVLGAFLISGGFWLGYRMVIPKK
jgi:hypothetical protein